jgi:ribosomal protein L7/L12
MLRSIGMNLSIEELATIICALPTEAREKLNAIVNARFGVDPNAKFVVRIANDDARAKAIDGGHGPFQRSAKIEAIKSVRIATGLGLGEGKHLVETGQWYAMSAQSAHEFADKINLAWRTSCSHLITDPEFVLATVEQCVE